jgi:hypothetical protein
MGVIKVGLDRNEVTPVLEMVMSPVTATDVGTLPLLPTRMLPLVIDASFECEIAADALISASTTAPDAIAVTPALDIVTSPVTATDVGTFELFPTRRFPLVSDASFECAIAADALISAFTIAPEAIVVTPALEMVTSPVTGTDAATFELLPTRMFPLVRVASLLNASAAIVVTPALEMVTSPVTATDAAAFELLPTRMFPLVRVASLLNAIAALAATEAFVTEPVDGVLTPASEMVNVYVSDGIVLADWIYWNSFGYIAANGYGTFKETFHNGSALHEDVVFVFARRVKN